VLAALGRADALIKDLGRPREAVPGAWWAMALLVLVAGPVYGAFMGSFRIESGDRLPMVFYAAAKVPLLIFVTTAVCLPGFFVLNTVLGLRPDFGRAIRAILAGQAGLTVALASLGPLTRMAYISGADHRQALLFNAAMFTVATAVGHIVMLRRYRWLMADPVSGGRHRIMLWAWVALYAFVGIQMGWMLRPFVGNPSMPVAFFRDEPFSNAYLFVINLIFRG
jgi:hypothetical protein